MSATDGLFGSGVYDSNSSYKIYNNEHFYKRIAKIQKSFFLVIKILNSE